MRKTDVTQGKHDRLPQGDTLMKKVIHALSFLPSDERNTWVRIGMALKSEFGENGFLGVLWQLCQSSTTRGDLAEAITDK